jgi:hypothetical protein
MKIITLTLHIDIEEAQTIITFIDELKTVLLANYGEEIQENHRANEVIMGTDQIMGIRVPVDIVPQQLSKAKLCLYFYRF